MRYLDITTIWLCKLVFKFMRLRGSHGAALPGLIAEKLNPGLLAKLTTFPEGIIVISGTNGKTTTTHLLSETLTRMGKKVFTNHSGSNMTRGLLASIVRFSDFKGNLDFDIAVLEIDEAYAAKLAPILKPKACILTNVLRDQLDRFGEIDHTAKLLKTLASETTKLVVYNATDKRLEDIPTVVKGKTKAVAYGFASGLEDYFPDDDSLYSGSKKQIPRLSYTLESASDTQCRIKSKENMATLNRSLLPGWHNVLNLVSVYSLVSELYGAQDTGVFDRLTPPYGRGEIISVGGCELTLQLVKNPAGFRTAMTVLPEQPALVIINDLIADGRDVSWLWDVNVSSFKDRPNVSTAGTRAYDMAVRLHYDDINCSDINVDLEGALKRFVANHKSGVLFLTYTAMLGSRKILKNIQTKEGGI